MSQIIENSIKITKFQLKIAKKRPFMVLTVFTEITEKQGSIPVL